MCGGTREMQNAGIQHNAKGKKCMTSEIRQISHKASFKIFSHITSPFTHIHKLCYYMLYYKKNPDTDFSGNKLIFTSSISLYTLHQH